jgi:hypothetical protein
MLKALRASWGWLLGAVTVLGATFTFLFFLTKPQASVGVGWFYLVLFIALCVWLWLVGTIQYVLATRNNNSRIVLVFSPANDLSKDLNFLLDKNVNFSPLVTCSVYHLRDGLELYIGSAVVTHVQDDGRIQVKVLNRELAQGQLWGSIEGNDKSVIDRLQVKVGGRAG